MILLGPVKIHLDIRLASWVSNIVHRDDIVPKQIGVPACGSSLSEGKPTRMRSSGHNLLI